MVHAIAGKNILALSRQTIIDDGRFAGYAAPYC